MSLSMKEVFTIRSLAIEIAFEKGQATLDESFHDKPFTPIDELKSMIELKSYLKTLEEK